MWIAYIQFFSKNISLCAIFNDHSFNDTLTNDIVSFEQLGPDQDWLCWGLTTRQPLWVILCRLPEKGRKVIEEIVEEMKERDREERNRNESEETEEIKIFPIYPYLLQG